MWARLILIFTAVNFISPSWAKLKSVECERIDFDTNGWQICFMNKTTKIDTKAFTVVQGSNQVFTLWFNDNKNVIYLPVKLSETFLHLGVISARGCTIKTIDKIVFENLSKLTYLDLSFNQIETIEPGTFEDLTLLQFLGLGMSYWVWWSNSTLYLFSSMQTTIQSKR